MANILEEIGTNKVMTNKKPYFIEKDSNGLAVKLHKLEHLTNRQENELLNQIYEKELAEEKAEKKKQEEKAKELELLEKERYKEKVLKAVDYFLRDFKEDLLDYTYEQYEEVVTWYKEYIYNNEISIISYLEKYL